MVASLETLSVPFQPYVLVSLTVVEHHTTSQSSNNGITKAEYNKLLLVIMFHSKKWKKIET